MQFEIINKDLDKRSLGEHGKGRNEADEEFAYDPMNEKGRAKSITFFRNDINAKFEGDGEEAA